MDPKPLDLVKVPTRLVTAYERAQELTAQAKIAYDKAKNDLIKVLDGHDAGQLKDGRFATYKQVVREEYTVAAGSYMKLSLVKSLELPVK